MSRKVAIVVGTRPEVVKLAPVYHAMRGRAGLRPVLISTGQHKEMLQQALAAFALTPDADLAVMDENQPLHRLTARVLSGVFELLMEIRPAALLVQGDTTTAFAAALAAFYARIPVGHVEAGLRTYNFEAPWPEEMNRRLIDPIARWCFAPTTLSRDNLLAERIAAERIHVTGNTVIDALLWMREKQRTGSANSLIRAQACGVPPLFAQQFFGDGHSQSAQPEGGRADGRGPTAVSAQIQLPRWILVTGHRRESFGAGFENICRAIRLLIERYPEVGVVYPVHLNPNVQKPVKRLLGGHERIALVEPLGYEDFIWLMDRCYFILSDSGGVQEEAPSLGKPVLVMRDTTERPEGIHAGTSRLVGTDPKVILSEAGRLIEDPEEYGARSALRNPYGDGRAATRIVDILERDLA